MMSEKKQKNTINNNIISSYSNKKGFGLNSENYLEKLKQENISLNAQIKKLNDTINYLKSQISNYEIEKNKLLLSSSKKDTELKEIKQKLTQTKLEIEKIKQNINKKENNNNSELKKIDEYQKTKELNKNLLSQLQNKITDLELLLKKKEGKVLSSSNSTKNIFLSPLQNSNNISIFIPPSLNKIKNSQSASDLFLTGTDELAEMRNSNQRLISCINDLKQEITVMGKDRAGIQEGLNNLTKERNNLVQILKNKNEEISNKLEQQNKLSKNLLEQMDKNQKLVTYYKKIKIKNKSLEINKKLLEDVVFKQETKVLKLSKSYKDIMNLMNVKDEEISKNKSYILTLENTIKDLKNKFEKMKNDEKEHKIKELELKIKILQKNNEKKNVQKEKIFENNNNFGNNIHNINYFIESPRFNSKNDYFKNKQKLFKNKIQPSSIFNSFNVKKNNDNIVNNKKILINNYRDKNISNLKVFNDNIRYKIYNKNKINKRGKLLKHDRSNNEIINNHNISQNIYTSNSLSLNKKIINNNEDLKEKEKIDQFKSFFNQFVKQLEND